MTEVLLSQLAHVEVFSPCPDDTVRWFTDTLGLAETTRDGRSVYLRGWGEWLHHSVQVTEGDQPGMGRAGWRTQGPDDVAAIAERVESSGIRGEWFDDLAGQGRTFRFRAPGGHLQEVFWEVERYQAPPQLRTDMPDRPQKYRPRGAAVRYIDHVTIGTDGIDRDVEFYKSHLGHRHTARVVPELGSDMTVFSTLTTNHSGHDLGLVPDFSGVPGRINHVAFWVDQRHDVLRAADVFLGDDTLIEFGPGVHGIGEITYLYVREPGGLRIELNSGGYRNFLPDWEPATWTPDLGSVSFYRNLGMPESMMESFPPAAVNIDELKRTNQFA